MRTSEGGRRATLAAVPVASDSVNAVDGSLIANTARNGDPLLEPWRGAYRVPGVSGSDDDLQPVMVEIIAPMTYAGASRYLAVGGVVEWTGDDGCRLASMQRRQLDGAPSPSDTLTPEQEPGLHAGLGWFRYAGTGSAD